MSTLSERLRESAAVEAPWYELHETRVLMNEAADALDALAAAVAAVRHAVDDAGPRPDVHQKIMARHRAEWPTLWDAVDWLIR